MRRRPLLPRASAIAPLLLLAGVLPLQHLGERWWPGTLVLYAPPLLWCLVSAASLLAKSSRRAVPLAMHLLALSAVLVGPLELTRLGRHGGTYRAPTWRLFSQNVDRCRGGFDAIVANVLAHDADIVVLQEACTNADYVVRALRDRYPTVQLQDEFLIATRLPLLSVKGQDADTGQPARSLRYELSTPRGRLVVYSLHPTSLRPGLLEAVHSISSEELDQNVARRRLQLSTVLEAARQEVLPTVLAGDVNIPAGSQLEPMFEGFADAYLQAGQGLGWTYPSALPWLRIDRVYTSAALRCVAYRDACSTQGDHHCVIAELALAR